MISSAVLTILQVRDWFQKLAPSSKLNSTPPTGAPKAAETPAAAPPETKSRFSVSLRKYSNNCKVKSYLLQYKYDYRISSVIRRSFFLPKQSQKSKSVLQDGSRSLGLFRKGKTRIIAKCLRADLVICSHSREGETPSYNQINTVMHFCHMK